MTVNAIPRVLYENKISEILDEIRVSYGILVRKGIIFGLIAVDQDAKVIAVDSRFDSKLNYWDLSSIGAALYGIARQCMDFFDANYLERGDIILNNVQLFVKSLGPIDVQDKRGKREVLIVILADKDVNIGVILLQMDRFGKKIKEEIEKSSKIKDTLKLTEKELKIYINNLKKEIFSSKDFVPSTP